MSTLICPHCKGTGRIRDERVFGREMQKRRKTARLTLRELSTELGKSIGYLSDLEHGRKRWGQGMIIAYGDAVERLAKAATVAPTPAPATEE